MNDMSASAAQVPANVRDIRNGRPLIPVAKVFKTSVQTVERPGRGQYAGQTLRLIQLTIEFVWEGGAEQQRYKQRLLMLPDTAVASGEALVWQGEKAGGRSGED